MRHLPLAMLTLVSLAACDSGPEAQNKAKLAQMCDTELNTSEEVCGCISELAQEELTADGVAFVIAAIEKNDAVTTELRTKMPLEEVTKSAMFMSTAPAKCAEEAVAPAE